MILLKKIEHVPNHLLSGVLTVNPETKYFRFKTIEVRDVKDAISKIKIFKTCGSDNISSLFFLQYHTMKTSLLISSTLHLKKVNSLLAGKLQSRT